MAKILLVEDDAHILRILSMWLKRNGHELVEATDGLHGKQLLLEHKFDIVVSDVNMPRLDGIGMVRWLRDEQKSEMPVILLSSRSDQSAIAERLVELEVILHPKPFSPSRLVVEIERRLTGEGMESSKTKQEGVTTNTSESTTVATPPA